MDHERLLYPLMQPSLAMLAQDGRRMPPLFRSWLFWLGWAIPFSIGVVNGLNAYHPVVPEIELYGRALLFRGTTPVLPALSFTTVGMTYFLSQDIALGIWVFNVIAKLQQGAFNVLGVTTGERMEWVTVPLLAHQNIGAMTVLVLFGLWVGRRHLGAVLRKAFRGDPAIDDSDEMMSYRAAVFTILGGSLFMLWWLVQTGLPPWVALLTLFMAFVIFQGLTLMVTQGGFFIARTPMNPGNFMVSGFGVEAIGGRGVTALGYTWSWAGEMRIFVMAACANALHLARHCLRGNRRLLLWAMLVAIAASAVGSVWAQLALGYQHGGHQHGRVLHRAGEVSLQLHRPTPDERHALAPGRLAVDRLRRRSHVGAAAGKAALPVVADPPHEPAHQCHADDRPDHAERLPLVAAETVDPQVRRTGALQPRQAPVHRAGGRPLHLHVRLGRDRRLHGHDGQPGLLPVGLPAALDGAGPSG